MSKKSIGERINDLGKRAAAGDDARLQIRILEIMCGIDSDFHAKLVFGIRLKAFIAAHPGSFEELQSAAAEPVPEPLYGMMLESARGPRILQLLARGNADAVALRDLRGTDAKRAFSALEEKIRLEGDTK